MTRFFIATCIFGAITLFSGAEAFANQGSCKCPLLSKKNLEELYNTGQVYESYNGYIPYTSENLKPEMRAKIEKAVPGNAIFKEDGTCVCKYSVQDIEGHQLDDLGLWKMDQLQAKNAAIKKAKTEETNEG